MTVVYGETAELLHRAGWGGGVLHLSEIKMCRVGGVTLHNHVADHCLAVAVPGKQPCWYPASSGSFPLREGIQGAAPTQSYGCIE